MVVISGGECVNHDGGYIYGGGSSEFIIHGFILWGLWVRGVIEGSKG